MSQIAYFDIISGRTPGLPGTCARLGLRLLSWPYSMVVRARNGLYSMGLLKSHSAGVPVLCIGNLTTGGTGKTPLVVWLCKHLRAKGFRCAILTRGYKTRSGEVSDEPALLAAQCPDAPVIVNPDRVAGAVEAIRTHRAQVLVMDDGFQHRRLARDQNIVAIDATNPFGYGRLLPAGLLREPVSGLKRAQAVVLTRCNQVSEESLAGIETEIRRVNPDLVVARSIHAPVAVRTASDEEIPLAQVEGTRVFAFCGIGNPHAFFRTVEELHTIFAGSEVFDDHHRYTAEDMLAVRRRAQERRASLILTTQKDWTKATQCTVPPGGPPLAYLAVEARITAGEEMLTALIDRVLGGRIPGQ
ncbi:MAG: tetraacyldisaccharide 4'-kinase [Phycisphaerae bacterium]|nr:tetraacyldisaccharide 4'-kinase [Phycisphaerae bacterium]